MMNWLFGFLLKSCRFFFINMSTTPSPTGQNEQALTTAHPFETAISCEEILDSSVAFTLTPTLPGQVLTEYDYEDNLMELVDELIHKFLSRTNRPSPYRSLFTWTFDDGPNLSYSVVLKVEEPSPMI